MVKKINKDKKKITKNKKKKSAEIVNFINKSKVNNKIQTEQMEARRMDNLSKELVDSYEQLEEKKFKIFNNQDFRSMLSIKQKFFAQAINDKADHFWREILLPPQST